MQELIRILQALLGRVFPPFGIIQIKASIVNGQIESIKVDDITVSHHFKSKDLPDHV